MSAQSNPNIDTPAAAKAHPHREAWRAAFASWAGTTIEWYDFFIYGTAAALVFGQIFFPGGNPAVSTILALATYGVGYVARPIGTLIFSHYGDKIGRKKSLVITLLMMGIATLAIGFLPTYETIGIWAPILLVALRAVQGIAAAGEWGGAALMSIEHAPAGRKTLFGTFVQLGSPSGSLFASVAFLIVTMIYSPDAFRQWAWRIPFLFSAVLIAIGLWIRLNVSETPEFEKLKKDKKVAKRPIVELISQHPREILLAIGINFMGASGVFIVLVYMQLIYAKQVGFTQSQALLAGALFSVSSMLTFPVWGVLADRLGRRRVALTGTVYTIVLAYPMFWMASSGNIFLFLLAAPVCYLGASCAYAVSAAMTAQLFPVQVRYSGISIGYVAASVIGAGPAPAVSAWMVMKADGAIWPVPAYLMAMGCVTLFTLLASKRFAVEEN
ncbi:MFS transporter [Variovorax sp. GB1P17]|uniref:MFS transporter n=1 Tax=Variovorax sp. GB1P17 TaxID=3443740 RepID=UPI003F485C0B